MKKLTELWGSLFIKRLQIIALIIAALLYLIYCCKCDGHVDLHFHSLEWEIQEEKRQEQSRNRKEVERSLKENDPNISKEDLKREVQQEIRKREAA